MKSSQNSRSWSTEALDQLLMVLQWAYSGDMDPRVLKCTIPFHIEHRSKLCSDSIPWTCCCEATPITSKGDKARDCSNFVQVCCAFCCKFHSGYKLLFGSQTRWVWEEKMKTTIKTMVSRKFRLSCCLWSTGFQRNWMFWMKKMLVTLQWMFLSLSLLIARWILFQIMVRTLVK